MNHQKVYRIMQYSDHHIAYQCMRWLSISNEIGIFCIVCVFLCETHENEAYLRNRLRVYVR